MGYSSLIGFRSTDFAKTGFRQLKNLYDAVVSSRIDHILNPRGTVNVGSKKQSNFLSTFW